MPKETSIAFMTGLALLVLVPAVSLVAPTSASASAAHHDAWSEEDATFWPRCA